MWAPPPPPPRAAERGAEGAVVLLGNGEAAAFYVDGELVRHFALPRLAPAGGRAAPPNAPPMLPLIGLRCFPGGAAELIGDAPPAPTPRHVPRDTTVSRMGATATVSSTPGSAVHGQVPGHEYTYEHAAGS